MTVALIAVAAAVAALLWAEAAWRKAEAAEIRAAAESARLEAVLFGLAGQVQAVARSAADARKTAVATAEFVDAALGLAGDDGADLMRPTPRPDASAN